MFRSCSFYSISIEAKMRIKSLNCLQFAAHEFILNINFYFTFASLCETSFSLYLSFENYIQTLYLTSTESKYVYLFAFWNSKRVIFWMQLIWTHEGFWMENSWNTNSTHNDFASTNYLWAVYKVQQQNEKFFLEMSVFTIATHYFISNLPGTQQNLGTVHIEQKIEIMCLVLVPFLLLSSSS